MSTVGGHDARTRLSRPRVEAEAGGEVVITPHGEPAARLVHAAEADPARGRGSMRDAGNHADWDAFTAGDHEVEEIFGAACSPG